MSDNPARVSFHLGGPGIMTPDKQFSVHVSMTLDCLGKSQDMVKYRVKMYKEQQRLFYNMFSPLKLIIAGSKGEGLTSHLENDHDQMLVLPCFVCADDVRPYTHNRNTTVFQTERHDTPAGYTKLKLVQEGHRYSRILIHDSLFQNSNGKKYISSDFVMSELMQVLASVFTDNGILNLHARSGPSMPASNCTGDLHVDSVYAFNCVCPDLLQAFITRPRPYNRPSRRILNDISNMDAHVVPVGCKDSDTSYQEWRICFTEAEIHFINNFDVIETKLYSLLKMIAKLFKNISNDITSYTMKNIVLWMVELYPADMFTEELLTTQLIEALKFLRKCVEVSYLPSYMIPDRNLLAGRLEPLQRQKLISLLSTLINEEGRLLLRCNKLRMAMVILYREPDMAEELRWRRDTIGKLLFLMTSIGFEKMGIPCFSLEQFCEDKTVSHIVLELLNIAFPDWQEVLLNENSLEASCCILYEKLKQLLL